MGYTQYNNEKDAAAHQKAEEEKARRRTELNNEMSRLYIELSNVNSQISSLVTEQSNLNTYMEDWINQKAIYSGNDILSEVVIVNTFEGVIADKMRSEIQTCISEMDQTHSNVGVLNENVGTQISRLRQYAGGINGRIQNIKNELNTL